MNATDRWPISIGCLLLFGMTVLPASSTRPVASPARARAVQGANTHVSISDASPGTTIYYTTNGSTPTTSSTVYSGPILVVTTTTIKAIAVAPGWSQSSVGNAKYTMLLPIGPLGQ